MTLAHTNESYPIFSYPEVRDVRDGNTVFAAVAAFTVDSFGLEANGVTRPVWGFEVSGQYFEAVALKPFLGRLLQRADDDHPGASEAAVLSWPAWKSDFGADPNIVGKTIRLNKQPYTIVGVTPEGFYGTEKFLQPDIFVPMANQASLNGYNWLESRHDQNIWSIVRLKDGVTMPQVQAELKATGARAAGVPADEGARPRRRPPRPVGDLISGPPAHLGRRTGRGYRAARGLRQPRRPVRGANRGPDRLPSAWPIGSSRWRVIRQVLVEAFVISILGGICACGLAWMALTGLANWHPPTEYPFKFHIMPQPSLIMMAFLISVFAGVGFGVMPLWQIFKTDPNSAIKSGGSQSTAGRRWALRDVLLAAQIALCCVTVTAAFVSLRGLGKAMTMNMGINPRHAVVAKFQFESGRLFGRRCRPLPAPVAGKSLPPSRSGGSRIRAIHAALPGHVRFRYLSATDHRFQTFKPGIRRLRLRRLAGILCRS